MWNCCECDATPPSPYSVVSVMQPHRLLIQTQHFPIYYVQDSEVFSIMLAKSQQQRLEVEQLPSFCGGWSSCRSKRTYSSKAFCSCCRFLFWKSHSFLYWMKLFKMPFCMIWFDLPIIQLCLWNESKQRFVVQRWRPPLSLVIEERTWLHSHSKTIIKSPKAIRNIVWPTSKVKMPSYTEHL